MLKKRDNGSMGAKIKVRRAVMFDGATVLECFAGQGAMYRHVWNSASFGACMDYERSKIIDAAGERECWACYVGDSIKAIRHGFMGHVPFDIVDIDAYGSPWETVHAWFISSRRRAPVTTLIITDGVWAKVKIAGMPKILLASASEDRLNGWNRDRYFERVMTVLDQWSVMHGLEILSCKIEAPNKVRGRPDAIKMAQYTIRVQNNRGDRSDGIDPNQTEGMA